ELVAGETERLARRRLVDAEELVHHAPRLHVGRPLLDAALAATHADFERLLGDRTIGEDADPELARALQVAGDRHARRLDLARGEPSRLRALHREVAELDVAPAVGEPAVVALLHLAILGSLGGKHDRVLYAPAMAGRRLRRCKTSPLKTQT